MLYQPCDKAAGANDHAGCVAERYEELTLKYNPYPSIPSMRLRFAVAVVVAIMFAGCERHQTPPVGQGETFVITPIDVPLGGNAVVDFPINSLGVQIRVRLHPGQRFDRYRVIVRMATGAIAWKAENLASKDFVLSAEGPRMMKGTYRIDVEGGSTPLGLATLEVR